MNMRERLDISAYLVLGPENTGGRPVEDVVRSALRGGFTCIQIRSKTISARDLIACTYSASRVIAEEGSSSSVALLVNDRLDVALAARMQGIKVDGVHVGQDDIPAGVCRALLGEDAVVGLTAPRTVPMAEYVRSGGLAGVDYIGAGPLHDTPTKASTIRDSSGRPVTRSLAEFREIRLASPVPVVAGGGVKLADLGALAEAGMDGFFVVSAITGAANPEEAAREMTDCWRQHKA